MRPGKGGDGEQRKPLIPSPPPFFHFVLLSLQFGAITRLEALATSANKAQDLTTSNANSVMIHQELMS